MHGKYSNEQKRQEKSRLLSVLCKIYHTGAKMNNGAFIFLVLTVLLSIVFGASYALDRRGKGLTKSPETPVGPISRIVLWISYGVIGMTILFIVGAFALREMFFVKLAGNFIFLYIFIGVIYRIIRPRGI